MKRNALKEMQGVASGEYGLGWEGKGKCFVLSYAAIFFSQLWTRITFGKHS